MTPAKRQKPATTALGALLQERREEAGFSRMRAAELSGVNVNTLEAWERGRIQRPTIHEVFRLTRVLPLSLDDLEAAVLADTAGGPASHRTVTSADEQNAHVSLLTRAIDLLGWTDKHVAEALNTSPQHIRAIRRGEEEMTALESLALIAVLAAYPPDSGGASREEITDLLDKLRPGVRS